MVCRLLLVLVLGHESLVNIHSEGQKVKPENIVIIGARSVDPGERELIKEKGIKVFTMHEIDRYGMTSGYGGSNCLFTVHVMSMASTYRLILMGSIRFIHRESERQYRVESVIEKAILLWRCLKIRA